MPWPDNPGRLNEANAQTFPSDLPMSPKASVSAEPGRHSLLSLLCLEGKWLLMLMDPLAHEVLSGSRIPSAALGCSCSFQAGWTCPYPSAVAAGGSGDVPLTRLKWTLGT